jgi:pyruvate dehydrogenase E1 component
MYPEQVRAFVPMRYTVLGTDGFGRSDTRENLRRHFEVSRYYVAQAAVAALGAEGKLTAKEVSKAIELYGIESAKPNPLGV